MIALPEAVVRLLRGPGASRVLRRLGIDPVRYWLLMDLFGKLSDRRELMTQLGRGDGMALKTAAWIYFVMAGLFSVMAVLGKVPLATHFWMSLAMTTFVLFTVLVSETSNSLVNAEEGLVLAHQPIDGATYTAAKLSHLLRIVLYFVLGLNTLPALAGLAIKGAGWAYPILHLLAALGVGILIALACCAVFGWLIRFVPARRLKSAGQVAELMPWIAIMLFQTRRHLPFRISVLPDQPEHRMYLMIGLGIAALAAVVFGIRSLSGDYLVRVSAIMHGSAGARSKAPKPGKSALLSRLCGGPAGRAGFEYVARMMLRDWHFRRQLIPILPMVVMPFIFIGGQVGVSPFSGRFTPVHLLPHVFGMLLFWLCLLLPYGNDYKGAWLFLLAPARAFRPFARGVYALLWLRVVLIPHVVVAVALAWFWGIREAALFTAYSMAVASLYLGLELRLIDGIPFGKQPEPSRGNTMLPLMIAAGIVMALVVAAQYFLIFRSPLVVVVATLAAAAAARFLASNAVTALENSMRFNLGLISGESKVLYTEV